ncbi:MFS transporter [Streptomyces gamaensis]|uniref:MFS transporter n=1 Tax=Streptomyces gamaensis TaxID=1763542 RepID=A0ABW0YVZ6_9ACTN
MTNQPLSPARPAPDTSPPPASGRPRRSLLTLMAVATGLSVSGNYFAQPLLELVSRDLGIGTGLAALVVTAGQAGYALGLILLVPLGDVVDRRRLTVGLFTATALFLAVTAAAPTGPVLLAGTVLTALASTGAQVVVPLAASLASPAERARTVGFVMSGILLGGLLARTVSGGLASAADWRTVYWTGSVLMAVMAVLLHRFLPRLRTATAGLRYPALLASTVRLLGQERVLRRRSLLAALTFSSYSVQLTSLTFLLARPPYGWSEAAIGLFGLVGVVGVATTPLVARLGDRGRARAVTGAGTALMAAGWLLLLPAGSSLVWLVVGVVAMNAALQSVLNSSQTVVYALRPEARNRVNSAFMTCYFIGGATGSALASAVWAYGSWPMVCALGAGLAVVSFLLWARETADGASGTGGREYAEAVGRAAPSRLG